MNESTLEGVFNEAKGKIKQATGETFNDQSLANEGAGDEVKGHAQQTWGSVKDTAHDLTSHSTPTSETTDAAATDHTGTDTGHDLRSGITNAAASVKQSIQRGLDHLEHRS